MTQSDDRRAFKFGDNVVILCQNVHGAYYDVPGVYNKRLIAGTDKGKNSVTFNGINFHVTDERLAPSADYFHAYHNNKAALPAGSTGRLQFVEYVESDGGRGRFLPEILKNRGDNENEKK